MLMQGSGRTIQQRKEDLFDEYERFRAIGNESIHDYFVRFHKLVNDMKITQLNIPTHQMNTKFVNNLPAYWGKYVTNVKQNMDISTTPYVQIYTHLKAYEPHAKKTLKKQEQSTSIVDPLAYVAHTTSAPVLSSPSNYQSSNNAQRGEALMLFSAFMDNLSSTGATNYASQCGTLPYNQIFDNVDYTDSGGCTRKKHLDSDCYETEIDVQFDFVSSDLLNTEAPKMFQTEHPTHHPVSIWDSEEVLVHQVVSMKKMNEKPGHVRPENGFYEKLNALKFVPQQELSREQAYWLSANEIASNASNPATPVTPFVHNRPPPSQVLFHLQKVNAVFHQFEGIINERTTQKPLYVSEWCFDYAKQFVEQQLVPFYDHFKKHIESANETIFKEVKEYEQIFDDLDAEYERCVLDNKNLTIEKKNLLIKNDCLIAECLEKDICSIVLTSDIVVPPSSNCLCEDLRSACDREHTKVLELEAEVLKQQKMVIESEKRNSHLQKTHIDLQLKFQNYKQCIDTSSASNAIFEINKLRDQLQGKDDTIRNLDAQINIMKVLNVGSTEGSCDQQALDTDRIQLKDMITSLRIQLDGLKVENVSLKRRYDELSKANTHSRTAYTEKINALTAENAKLKTELSGKKSGGSTASEKPKVLASGMYTKSSKYIPPPKRANWVKPTPLPKKKQVTFQEPPRTSKRPTQKPPVQQNKKPNVSVNLSTRTKPATESRKPMPKSHTRNHHILPNKSVNARRAAYHNRKLNVVDHNQFVIRSLKSVNTKTPQAPQGQKHSM
ncbi:hypothetical protein Tco_0715350 [Tanacetum coccineum]